jgi:hypothetical protein
LGVLWSAEVVVEVAEVFRVEEEAVLCPYWKILMGCGRISVVGRTIYEVGD